MSTDDQTLERSQRQRWGQLGGQLWDNYGDNFGDNLGTIWRQLGDNLPNSGDLNDNAGDNTAMEQAGDSGPMIL